MPQNNNLLVSVVIPVFNQVHLTIRCLNSILENSSLKLEIFIIDNASIDNTAQVLLGFQDKFNSKNILFSIISNHENVGFGRAMNQGARLANGKYIALLNNDTWLMKAWDKALVSQIEALKVEMICPYFYEGPFVESEMASISARFISRNKGKKTKEWGSIMMFFNLESFKQVGMFDEDYFVTFEDNDLLERCKNAGFQYYLVGDCFIWHHSKGTRGSMEGPSKFEVEGLEIFVKKWGFDPRLKENTFFLKLLKSFRKWKRARGLL